MPKSVGGAEGCLVADGVKPVSKSHTTLLAELRFETGSESSTSAGSLRTLCTVFGMLSPAFMVLNPVILFAAPADNSGWWPPEPDSSL